MHAAPAFIRASSRPAEAFELASAAHRGGETDIAHPLEVAQLVHEAGGDEDLVAAALLHDVIEDSGVRDREIAGRFGDRVAVLVAALTEDETITDYHERKAEHRARVRRAGADAALIFTADKLANARSMQRGTKEADERKVGHYAATLAELREDYPELPLLPELETELEVIRRAAARSPA